MMVRRSIALDVTSNENKMSDGGEGARGPE